MVIEVGSDWGEASYVKTEKYDTKEDLDMAFESLGYYDIPLRVNEIIEHEIEYASE